MPPPCPAVTPLTMPPLGSLFGASRSPRLAFRPQLPVAPWGRPGPTPLSSVAGDRAGNPTPCSGFPWETVSHGRCGPGAPRRGVGRRLPVFSFSDRSLVPFAQMPKGFCFLFLFLFKNLSILPEFLDIGCFQSIISGTSCPLSVYS